MKKIGLALSGGGAKGFAHIGILKELDDLKVRPDMVSGCSMGSIIGALYCLGFSGEQIERKVDEITVKKLIKLLFNHRNSPNKVESFLNEILEEKNFEDLIIPLYVNAVDINTGEEVIFYKGNLAKAIRASIAIPTIFKPAIINGRVLVDGGVRNNLPIQILIDKGMTKIIGVNTNPSEEARVVLEKVGGHGHHKKAPSIPKILAKSISIIQSNDLIINYYKTNCNLLITPKLDDFTLLDFGKKKQIIKAGEKAARAAKKDMKTIFRFQMKTSANIKKFFKKNFIEPLQ